MTAPTTKREAYEFIASKNREIEAARQTMVTANAPALHAYQAAIKPHNDIYNGIRVRLVSETRAVAEQFDIQNLSMFDHTADDVQRSDEEWQESWSESNC